MSLQTGKLRILPLGGCGEIGKNMTVLEYDNQIIIIDAGIMFPHNDMLGVDAVIPDYNYLKDKWNQVIGVLITHGHEDHIGAISYLMEHTHAPVFGTPLTAGFLRNKLREAKLGDRKVEVIQADDTFSLGPFTIEPFHVTHSIPDCVGFGITTPVGLVVHTGDYKFDHTPVDGWPPDFAKLAQFSARGVLCLLADSTNSERPGWTPSESTVSQALDEVFKNAKGRVLVASFASLISRIWQVAEAAHRHGRKLALAGRSMQQNVKIAQQLGYLDLPENLLIDAAESGSMPAHKVTIMVTGSQGEPTSVLGRLARGRHQFLRVRADDTVVISAHTIPGNEETIHRIINSLMQRGADVLYENTSFVHVSGHAAQEEMRLMINLIRPKFFIPVHGELRHLKQHGKMARQLGIPAERIAVVENGTPVDLDADSMTVQPRLKGGYIFVQGGSAGDISFPDIRDRERLARAGFFLASLRVTKGATLAAPPKFVSEGFVDINQTEGLLTGAEEVVRSALSSYKSDRGQLAAHIQSALGRFVYAETGLRPNVYAVVHDEA